MDSSSSTSSQNSWLAFSLSNNPHLNLSLFEAFSSPNPASVVDSSATTTPECIDHVPPGSTDLAMFTGSAPKLEDFLGSRSAAPPPPKLAQFPAEPPPINTTTAITASAASAENIIYDSELKSIAASFFRGNNSSAAQTHPQLPPAPVDTGAAKKAVDTFGQRTSIYRGVTRHRWTGRYEAHLWDNSCRREGQSRKGRQVYLGGYDKEEKAARAYDLAALKYWGPTTTTNFSVSNYETELEDMKNMTRQEFVASLRRKSSGFSRGASIYRGVTRHHQHGRWQARIGRVAGNKDLYLGTFSTQEEAAEAYDIAAIKFRGLNAVTNFDMSRYDVKSIARSNLPIGGMAAAKTKQGSFPDANSLSVDPTNKSASECVGDSSLSSAASSSSTLSFAVPIKEDPSPDYWSNIFGFQNPSNNINNNTLSLNPITVAKSPSTGFNVDFSSTGSANVANGVNNNVGGFYGYTNLQQQQQSGAITSCANTVPFAMPIVPNNSNSYEGSSTGYNINGIGWNNIAPTLHTLHHQTHAKPSTLFQTPIFGME